MPSEQGKRATDQVITLSLQWMPVTLLGQPEETGTCFWDCTRPVLFFCWPCSKGRARGNVRQSAEPAAEDAKSVEEMLNALGLQSGGKIEGS